MAKFKNPLSFQVDYDRKSIFKLASDKDKEEQTFMRPSTSFMGDAIRRFKRNKVAVVSFFFISKLMVCDFKINTKFTFIKVNNFIIINCFFNIMN